MKPLEEAPSLEIPLLVYRDGAIVATVRTALTDEYIPPADIARDIIDNRLVVTDISTIAGVWEILLKDDSASEAERAPLDLFQVWITQTYGLGLRMNPYNHGNTNDLVNTIVHEVIRIKKTEEEN